MNALSTSRLTPPIVIIKGKHMLAHTQKNFQSYPTNRVVAMIDTKKHADDAVKELVEIGVKEELIDESYGLDGMVFLDPYGINHGTVNNLIRKWQMVGDNIVHDYVDDIIKNLEIGMVVVSAPVDASHLKEDVGDVLMKNHAVEVKFYAKDHMENLH